MPRSPCDEPASQQPGPSAVPLQNPAGAGSEYPSPGPGPAATEEPASEFGRRKLFPDLPPPDQTPG